MKELEKKIEEALKGQSRNSLIWGIGQLLLDIAAQSEGAAEIITQDLDVKGMSLADLAKSMENYARKNKTGNGYFMDDETARRLVREFYKLPDCAEANPQTDAGHEESHASDGQDELLDLADFLI